MTRLGDKYKQATTRFRLFSLSPYLLISLSPYLSVSLSACLLLLGFTATAAVSNAEELAIDNIMWQDPVCNVPPIHHAFPPELVGLWTKALQHSDSELRRNAADTVAIAQQRGVAGLDGMVEQLVVLLTAPNSDPSVRRAAAHALVALDARDRAELLAQVAAQNGLEVAQFVEPALARWNYSPMRATWLQRFDDSPVQPLWLLLAIQSLGEVKETAARQPLLTLVRDDRSAANLRFAAAQSLASIFPDGLAGEATELAGNTSPSHTLRRLLGMTLLSHHSDQESIALLRKLATDAEPPIAAAALQRLFDINPELIFDLAAPAVSNPDVNVRRVGARALFIKSDIDAIHSLGPLLKDPNPSLRRSVAKALVELASRQELRATVTGEAEKMLATDHWRGLEQSTLVLVSLEQKQVADRLMQLMKHPRTEVAVTAAWALRRFRLPETLPAMLDHAEQQYQRIMKKETAQHELVSIEGQHSQIFQAFGELRFKEAEPLMRRFVPKTLTFGAESRAAACWSLGYLYEGMAPPDLTKQFAERLADVSSPMPEMGPVRRTCAASLGRMKSLSAVPTLQKFAELDGTASEVGQACWWSLEQLTGVKPPPIPELEQRILGWFLQPAE